MPRAKRGTKARARRKKIMKAARGMVGARRTVYKVAQQSVFRAMQHAFAGRKQKKRDYQVLMDHENKRGVQVLRHPLRPVHPWVEAAKYRTRPQIACRHGGERSDGVRNAYRESQRSAYRGCTQGTP